MPSSSPRSTFHEDFESRIDHVLGKGNFTEHDAASVTYSVLNAVDYLHHHGIVHQDLNCAFLSPSLHLPENILHCSNDPPAISSSSTLACKPHPFSTLDSHLLIFSQSKTHSFFRQATSTRIHKRNIGSLLSIYTAIVIYVLLCSHPYFMPMTPPPPPPPPTSISPTLRQNWNPRAKWHSALTGIRAANRFSYFAVTAAESRTSMQSSG